MAVDPATTLAITSAIPTSTLESIFSDKGAPTLKPRKPLASGEAHDGAKTIKDTNDRNHASTDSKYMYHGKIYTHGNQQYKMHQVARGMFSGVDLEDWDDAIHVKDDTELELDSIDLGDFGLGRRTAVSTALSPLEDRAFRWASCSAALACAYQVGVDVTLGVAATIDYFIRAAIAVLNRPTGALIQLKDKGANVWTFLNRPFVTEVTAGFASSVLGAYVGGRTQKSPSPVKECSDTLSDRDVIISAVQQIANAAFARKKGDVSDATFRLTLPSGQNVSFDVATRTNGDETPPVCGSPEEAPSIA